MCLSPRRGKGRILLGTPGPGGDARGWERGWEAGEGGKEWGCPKRDPDRGAGTPACVPAVLGVWEVHQNPGISTQNLLSVAATNCLLREIVSGINSQKGQQIARISTLPPLYPDVLPQF